MNTNEVRDIFEDARQARADLDHMRSRLLRIEAMSMSSGMPQAIQGGKSDPTANAGQALADLDTRETRETEARLIAKIDRAKRICSGVRRCFKLSAGDVLEDYYIRGLSWGQVTLIDHVSKATALRLRDMAFDWIAFVGEERAISGEGMAQDG